MSPEYGEAHSQRGEMGKGSMEGITAAEVSHYTEILDKVEENNFTTPRRPLSCLYPGCHRCIEASLYSLGLETFGSV